MIHTHSAAQKPEGQVTQKKRERSRRWEFAWKIWKI